jgi:hypothetical protein
LSVGRLGAEPGTGAAAGCWACAATTQMLRTSPLMMKECKTWRMVDFPGNCF